MIEIFDLQKSYTLNQEKLLVLDIQRLEIEKGERAAVIGPSGCGKSTLLQYRRRRHYARLRHRPDRRLGYLRQEREGAG